MTRPSSFRFQTFRTGDRVEVNRGKRGVWYSAKITNLVLSKSKSSNELFYGVRYDAGAIESNVGSDLIRFAKKGDKKRLSDKELHEQLKTIVALGNASVLRNPGTKRNHTELASTVTPVQFPMSFYCGDYVEVNCGGKGTWYSAQVVNMVVIRSEATTSEVGYDVVYSAGASEANVKPHLMRPGWKPVVTKKKSTTTTTVPGDNTQQRELSVILSHGSAKMLKVEEEDSYTPQVVSTFTMQGAAEQKNQTSGGRNSYTGVLLGEDRHCAAMEQARMERMVASMYDLTESRAKASWQRIKSDVKRGGIAELIAGCNKDSSNNKSKGVATTTALSTEVKAMDTLMGMTGLESVKTAMLDQYNRLNIAKLQGMDYGASNYNTRFDGNPGTGKTTVARLYAQFLVEVGVMPEGSEVVETTGSALSHGGILGLEMMLDAAKEVGGGVIFVDEAYQLDSQEGRKVLDFILTHAERLHGNYGALVWVFAGYNKKMDKLFEYNLGLPSRFPHKFIFDDYTDAELLKIWNGFLDRGGRDVVNEKRLKPKEKPVPPPMVDGVAKPDQVDPWGNTWKWNFTLGTYADEYGNYAVQGATYDIRHIGTSMNHLRSQSTNRNWTYHPDLSWWIDDKSNVRATYPDNGNKKPEPPAVEPEIPPMPPTPFVPTDPKWSRAAIRRIGNGRGRDGFGNARSVRNLLDLTLSRQSARLTVQIREGKAKQQNLFALTRDDILGPMATENSFNSCEAWRELQAMEGLEEVKESVRQLLVLVVQNAVRENHERPLLQIALNRVFLGNPGTGKTSVAKLYARILSHFGLLSKGEVILKNPSDFKGSALGNSEAQTRAILESAMGSVLVIDEAYGLCPSAGVGSARDVYGEAVIQTIVEQVTGAPGEDRAVVLLGYRDQMEQMMAGCNPGLARRFQLENAFMFPDYSDASLARILLHRAQGDLLQLSETVAADAVKQLTKAKALPNFGNAGAVNNMLCEAKLRMLNRQLLLPFKDRRDVLTSGDFVKVEPTVTEEELFRELVGCEEVRDRLRRLQNTIKFCQSNGMDPNEMCGYNYVFTGSSGTGKTTVARLMGKMFRNLGLIPCDEVVEVSASDLVTGFVGQAGQKTREMLIKARGKVLFIDEAYQLKPSPSRGFMGEVVDEIVKCLTSEDFVGKMVVILAGYAEPMDDMLGANPGLRSRFSERIYFQDFSVSTVSTLLCNKLTKRHLTIATPVEQYVEQTVAPQLKALSNFGNGRDVDNFFKKVFSEVADRSVSENSTVLTVEMSDLDRGMQQFLNSRQCSTTAAAGGGSKRLMATKRTVSPSVDENDDTASMQYAFQGQDAPPPPPMETTIQIDIEPEAAAEEEAEPSPADNLIREDGNGFGGGSDNMQFLTVVQDLLRAQGQETEAGVAALAGMSMDDPGMGQYLAEVMRTLSVGRQEAVDLMREWQVKQGGVKDQLHKEKAKLALARGRKKKVQVAIWRCAVCGRADLPYIACFVAPFIVGYQEQEI